MTKGKLPVKTARPAKAKQPVKTARPAKAEQQPSAEQRARADAVKRSVQPDDELARKIQRLFKIHPEGQAEYSHRRVVDEINEAAGENVMSQPYLWQLRNGMSSNPTIKRLKAIAAYFGVPAAYLLGGDEELDRRVEAELDDLELMQRHHVRHVAYQMAGMSEDGQAVVKDLGPRIAALPEEARRIIASMVGSMEDAARYSGGKPESADRQHN